MDIASNIERARVLAEKSQDEMANLLGISQQVYSNLIRGRTKKIDPGYIQTIKEKLDIDVLQPIVVTVSDDTYKKALKEPAEQFNAQQPTSTVDKLATALLTANESVSKLSDSVKSAAANIETVVSTNAQLANHVMQQVQPSNSDELKMLSAMRIFLHRHIISTGVMAQEEVRKELDTLIAAHGKASSIAYSFGI